VRPGRDPRSEAPIEVRLAAARLPPLPRTAWLEIDLEAIVDNLAIVRRAVGPGVAVEPVVKADAYGHGALPVAAALEAAGADGLCVAAYDEAVELRRGGIRVPILALYGVPSGAAADAARRRIAASVGDPALLDRLASRPPARHAPRLGIELEVETGLGRSGFWPAELTAAARAVRAAPGLELRGTWTHLQAPEETRLVDAQLDRFASAVESVRSAGIDLGRRHVLASGGLADAAIAARGRYDAVRPGLAIYGIAPEDMPSGGPRATLAGLRPAMSLRARPVHVADLPAGWGVSYGPTFTTRRPSRIATLPLGYGDGWSRALSNRAEALVRGVRVPLVGNVSMDAVMVDVTDVPGAPVGPDDEFVLIGEQEGQRITAVDLAQHRGTISWEVVTAMARRLPRVYHAGPEVVRLRTLDEPRNGWRGSNSGTATSATSRSTRS